MDTFKKNIYRNIGKKIKSEREGLKISQLELSEQLNISRASISNIELGRHQVSIHTLYQISVILNKNIKDFLPELKEINSSSSHNLSDYLKSNNLKIEDEQNIENIINNL